MVDNRDLEALARSAQRCADTAESPVVARCWAELAIGYRKLAERRVARLLPICGAIEPACGDDVRPGDMTRGGSHSSRLARALR